jgi:SAM-dependent methyltransferase
LATATVLRTLPPLMKPYIPLPGVAILVVALLGIAVSGCKTSPPSAQSTPVVGAEPSAKPGVNAEYLKPDLDVTQWVERFEREGREIYDHRAAIVVAARLKPGMVMADIGAGTGLFTPAFSRAIGPKGKVYAVDIVPAFLERIRERAASEGLANVQTVLCTERSVELPPNSIDLAFICDVYHHFEYPQSSLASLHRALRPGGEVLLVEFKRVPGKSSEWILNHVRAGQEVFTAEIAAAGFQQIEEQGILKDNYVVRFRKLRK